MWHGDPTDRLDASFAEPWWLLHWARGAYDIGAQHRDLLNRINVFPDADHDTGDNVTAFWGAFADGVAVALTRHGPAGATPAVLIGEALGHTTDVTGSSAAILRTWLTGWRRALLGQPHLTAPLLCAALRMGAEFATVAVARPVKGTMLSVFEDFAAAFELESGWEQVPAVAARAALRVVETAVGEVPVPVGSGRAGPHGSEDAGSFAARLVLAVLTQVLAEATTIPDIALPTPDDAGDGTDDTASGQGALAELVGSGRPHREAPAALAAFRNALAERAEEVIVDALERGLWTFHAHATDVAGVRRAIEEHVVLVSFDSQPVHGTGRRASAGAAMWHRRLVGVRGDWPCPSTPNAVLVAAPDQLPAVAAAVPADELVLAACSGADLDALVELADELRRRGTLVCVVPVGSDAGVHKHLAFAWARLGESGALGADCYALTRCQYPEQHLDA